MREILFHGKNRDGVWLCGDLRQNANAIDTDGINLGGDTFIEPQEYGDTLHSPDYYAVNPDTVGEYTGLTDKNGVRIFEGDIVGYVPWQNTRDFRKGVVRFGTYRNAFNDTNGAHGFYIEWLNNDKELLEKSLSYWAESVSVCGNIHDNPVKAP